MDRNTITGLVLIGLILTVFSIINRPSEEDIKKQQKEQVAKTEKVKINKNKAELNDTLVRDTTSANQPVMDDTAEMILDTVQPVEKKVVRDTVIKKETDKFIIHFSNIGGQIQALYLKEYKSYNNYKANKNEALCLFDKGDHLTAFTFYDGNTRVNTSNWDFDFDNSQANKIIFSCDYKEGKVVQSYQLKNGSFNVDYQVQFVKLDNVSKDNIQLTWKTSFLQTEKLLSEQRRVSTVCFNEVEEGFDYLSETSDDESDIENDVTWIAYKQSYFSSILQPQQPFQKKKSKMLVRTYPEKSKKDSTHVKDFESVLSLNLDKNSNNTISFKWFFGPNDYEILNEYNTEYDQILNFGWGLFRWINIYAVQPIFNFLLSTGMGLGIAILILTLIIKTLLMPVQWKMFVSSVKMKILKPKTEALNEKYPNKEDAMKKQMEMMNLYKESGASPLSGCLPMLIQMPILLAVFRFFPSSFELRQQSFLWADDLSSFDSIWDFGFSIPIYGDHMSLFTLLMAATTLGYTFMNSGNMQQPSQPGMPNMKVLMYIFPIMMIFFFNNYSSGLSYYYFVSTLFSILIMFLIKKFFVDEEKLKLKMEAKVDSSKNGKQKKKSRFQEKLEEMQRKQQEALKNKKK